MMNAIVRLVAISWLSTIGLGCAAVGNLLIPPHERSDTRGPDVTCVSFSPPPRESPALLAIAGEQVVKLAVAGAAKAIEKESKRYGATYSGRQPDYLLKVKDKGDPVLNVGGILVRRLAGKGADLG